MNGEQFVAAMTKTTPLSVALQFELALDAAKQEGKRRGKTVEIVGINHAIFHELVHQLCLFVQMDPGNEEKLYRIWGDVRFCLYEFTPSARHLMPDMEFFMFMDGRHQVIYSV